MFILIRQHVCIIANPLSFVVWSTKKKNGCDWETLKLKKQNIINFIDIN